MSVNAGRPCARALCAALRAAREASSLGVRELARAVDLSPVQISQYERGERIPGEARTGVILGALKVSSSEQNRILALVRAAKEPNWLTVGVNGVPQQLDMLTEHERAASGITHWEPLVIPGLLQTPDYTRSIKEAGGLQHEEIGVRLVVNAGRRDVVTTVSKPVNYEAIIGEAALLSPIACNAVMADQLRHIIDDAKRSNVAVRVMPEKTSWHPGLSGPFVFFTYPDAPPLVYLEHHSSGAWVSQDYDIEEYAKAIDWMRRTTLDPEKSLERIEKLAEVWEVSP
ncbi:helix-turn-helix transcriptional regulator [Saccharopolyspora sp. ASAGF58]|uniref:helix-turn-helix domain-containing protein n=1 Tax=Saccharopolyspora sp. ASAGF58 TaxID=2719023 RepID=UPI00144852EF|nr:helix-turn-helix transcriptional regulator [Saccharopolyspora sp. ASAGF58]